VRRFVVALLVLVLVVVVWFLRSKPEQASAPKSTPGSVSPDSHAVAAPSAIDEDKALNLATAQSANMAAHPEASAPKRFDPAAWPPLPEAGERVTNHLATLRDRADRGDVGAACWLAAEFVQCRYAMKLDAKVGDRASRNKDLPLNSAAQVASLEQEQVRVAMLDRCFGVTERDMAATLHYLRQGALGGSKMALRLMIVGDPLTLSPGIPDGAVVRQLLRERDAYVVAGLVGGVPESLDVLAYDLVLNPFSRAAYPGQPVLDDQDRGALLYLVQAMAERDSAMRNRINEAEGHDPYSWGEGTMPKAPDGATRQRLDRQVDRLMHQGWAEDPSWIASVDDVDGGSSAGCSAFTDPVDPHMDLKEFLRR